MRAPNLQSRQMGFAVKPFDQNQIHIGHQRERLCQIHGARIEQGCSVRSSKHHSGGSGAAIAVGVASVLIHGKRMVGVLDDAYAPPPARQQGNQSLD